MPLAGPTSWASHMASNDNNHYENQHVFLSRHFGTFYLILVPQKSIDRSVLIIIVIIIIFHLIF